MILGDRMAHVYCYAIANPGATKYVVAQAVSAKGMVKSGYAAIDRCSMAGLVELRITDDLKQEVYPVPYDKLPTSAAKALAQWHTKHGRPAPAPLAARVRGIEALERLAHKA